MQNFAFCSHENANAERKNANNAFKGMNSNIVERKEVTVGGNYYGEPFFLKRPLTYIYLRTSCCIFYVPCERLGGGSEDSWI